MTSPEPHCSSYYAATRNDDTAYPPLRGESRCDVCIVGAGFTGLSAAISLAERGYKVTVLEQHRVGWGATGRCGGQLIGGFPGEARMQGHLGEAGAGMLFDLGYRGHDLVGERVQRYGIDCDLRPGHADVALRPRHLEQQRERYEAHCARGMGDELSLLSGDEVRALLGTGAYLGGLVNRRNGHLHPLNLCLGEARAAASLGAAIHEDSEVTGIRHGPNPVVTTNRGSVRADSVLLAGNAYQHLEPAALSGLLFPAPSFIIATEPLTASEATAINRDDIAVCDQNLVPDYFRLSADRRLLFGGGCNYSGFETGRIETAMRTRLRRIYPQLADKRVDFAWSGKVGIPLTRIPLLGRIGDNVYYALGYSGHGVSLSHTCGEIMADAVAGTVERFDAFAAAPRWRLPVGRHLGGLVVAMGMLYFRLRDLV